MGLAIMTQDVLTRLATIDTVSADQVEGQLHVRLWNNQLDRMIEGSGYVVPMPSAFVEMMLDRDQSYNIGQGVTRIPLTVRVHLLQQHFNTEGSFDQDLLVYVLRDAVVRKLQLFKPSNSSTLSLGSESPDYAHDNIYHYVIDFYGEFIDFTGSKFDEDTGLYIENTPPIALQVNVNGDQKLPYP